MRSLYILPLNGLLAILMLLCVELLIQAYCVSYGFFRCRYLKKNIWSAVTDGGILIYLGLLLLYVAEATYHVKDGFVVVHPYTGVRLFFTALLLALSLKQIRDEKSARYLVTPGILALTLPWSEMLFHLQFPWILTAAILLWMVRSLYYLSQYARERRESLSAFSVKEAVDTMDFGILFCRGRGDSQGQILLCNRKMQELIFTLSGGLLYSGKEFYEILEEGRTASGCVRKTTSPNLVYKLADGSVWRFDLEFLAIRESEYALLTASDITRYSWTVDQLRQQNQELEVRNRELKTMLQNMESICRVQETLQAKSRVHDLLGQQISLILRSVREHREPDEALLRVFEDGLPRELKNTSADYESSLRNVAESFKSLGVSVTLEGSFPDRQDLQKAFFEIAAEGMTNAVRHGYASEIRISTSLENQVWCLRIWNNGTVKEQPILEGGGLRSMRRKTEELGGQFSYSTAPHFTVLVRIPKEEAR